MAFNLIFVQFLVVLVAGRYFSTACDPKPMIIKNEGEKPCMYLDIKGIKTIGVGYNMQTARAKSDFKRIGADFDKFFNGPVTKSYVKCNCSAVPCLSQSQINELLDISLQTAIADAQRVIPSFATLCCDVQNTMVDMSYTLGGPSFASFTTFAKLVARQYWKAAGDDLTVSKWCNAAGQDVKRCHRDAAIVARGCGCSGQYSKTCSGGTSCCSPQETCCKATFTYKGYITKTFEEMACCPDPKATCCTHNRCCPNAGEICCPAAPAIPSYCCPADYPHCVGTRQCSRDEEGYDVKNGNPIHEHDEF